MLWCKAISYSKKKRSIRSLVFSPGTILEKTREALATLQLSRLPWEEEQYRRSVKTNKVLPEQGIAVAFWVLYKCCVGRLYLVCLLDGDRGFVRNEIFLSSSIFILLPSQQKKEKGKSHLYTIHHDTATFLKKYRSHTNSNPSLWHKCISRKYSFYIYIIFLGY